MLLPILTIITASVVIYFSGNSFAGASSKIGDYFRLSKSVKGATLDAVASSFPELMIAIFSVVAFKQFDVGVGTIAGSAFFNLLIIPGIAALVAPVAFRISKEVIARDAMFYSMSVFVLMAAVLHSQVWGLIIPFILIFVYLWYIKVVVKHTKKYRKENGTKSVRNISIWREISVALGNMLVMGVSAYLLTEAAIELAHLLGIPAVIIAFTVIAAATSVPDAVISIGNAKKGNIDDATSNVFGSNIFDILIGLGVPIILAYFIMGQSIDISFEQVEVVIGLLGATILVIYIMIDDYIVTKGNAITLLFFYVLFLTYLIYLSFIGA